MDKGEISMDPWEMFSELCRRVVEDQNVYLEVIWTPYQVHFSLFPMEDFEDE